MVCCNDDEIRATHAPGNNGEQAAALHQLRASNTDR
jgi:hypothetical protein